MPKREKPKNTHPRIKSALGGEAERTGVLKSDTYNRFFRELFLHQLNVVSDGWVLKGGTNLYCRIPGARHTRDLDLYRSTDPTAHRAAALALIEVMEGQTAGPYVFRLTLDRSSDQGPIPSSRITVVVNAGVAKVDSFKIDVSGDLLVSSGAEKLTVQRSDSVDLPFASSSFSVHAYPLENQVADKVAAMYETHRIPPQASTRYRDLYDVALIALHEALDRVDLSVALQQQSRLRSLDSPEKLHPPSRSWPDEYDRAMKSYTHLNQDISRFTAAFTTASMLINPLLPLNQPLVDGHWDPARQSW